MLYTAIKYFIRSVAHTFFRDVSVDGLQHIPTNSAVIFVGNHQNQFMDAMLLMAHCPHNIGFLIAQKSMTGVIGFFARTCHSIPVARPQDSAKFGPGTISVDENSDVVIGTNTKFTSLDPTKHSLCPKGVEPMRIKHIQSDTELVLASPVPHKMENCTYKIFHKMDQTHVYDEVWNRLGMAGCIGIFPEGGSHDRTELLPLKAGVTIMALGAMAKFKKPVYIVPCGLNYFHGHRFRGSVLIEFGHAYRVPDRLAELYTKNQREACGELLETIKNLMETVIVHAPDRETLEALYLVRKLYQPADMKLTAEKYIELNHRFLYGLQRFKETPTVQVTWQKILEYQKELMMLGLRDSHIEESTVVNGVKVFGLVSARFILCVVTLVLALPGFLLNLPVTYTARRLAAKHQKEALAASEVKISGLDVLASKKVAISLVMTPPLYILYSIIAWWLWGGQAAFFAFFGLFFLTQATIRVAEQGVILARSLVAILKVRWIGSKIDELGKQRLALQKEIREAVDVLGPKMAETKGKNFEDWRIIKEDHFRSDKPMVNLTGRTTKPYKIESAWDTPIISDQEWQEMKDIFE